MAIGVGMATGGWAREPVAFDVSTPQARQETLRELQDRSATRRERALTLAAERGWPVRGRAPDGRAYELRGVIEGRPSYVMTFNVNAAISTAADRVRDTAPYDVGGDSVLIGVWDSGVALTNHQEFAADNRITVKNSAAPVDDHATHVIGTLAAAGVDPDALGMAPRVAVHSYDWNDDLVEMTVAATTNDPGQRIDLSNHSYGDIAGWSSGDWSGSSGPHWWGDEITEREDRAFGRYGEQARDWDALIYQAPHFLPFRSAGNDRNNAAPGAGTSFYYYVTTGSPAGWGWQSKPYDPDADPHADGWKAGGYNTISYEGVAKNVMTVGAAHDAVSGSVRDPHAAAMSSFSCWGPTDDGRIKPDIVANGVGLYSSLADAVDSYAYYSGTSMSSPNAAGSAVLLIDYYRSLFPHAAPLRAATLKGLIIHTADDLGRPGPDYRFGWGLMNTEAAAAHLWRHAEHADALVIQEVLLEQDQTLQWLFNWNRVDPVRATLSWTDPPGPVQDGLNSTNRVLLNDLDLRIIGPDGTVFLPYVLDPDQWTNNATRGTNRVDNVEQVFIPTNWLAASGTGAFSVEVTHDGSLTDGEQAFSLLLSGQAVTNLAEVSLYDLEQTYDGTPRAVGVSTEPPGLTVDLTYDGEPLPPVDAGSYAVVGVIDDAVFQGVGTGMLTVARAWQSIDFPAIADQIVTGNVELAAMASSGLPVEFQVASGPGQISDATNLSFSATGQVAVVASQVGNTNWLTAVPVTNVLTVTQAWASVMLNDLAQTYDGTPRAVGVSTEPPGLTVDLTYAGSPSPPVDAGSYAVVGIIEDAVYQGVGTGTLMVAQAWQSIVFPPIADQIVTGSVELAATASSGLPVEFQVVSGSGQISDATNLSFNGAGMLSVAARQPGNQNWLAAVVVTNSLRVYDLFTLTIESAYSDPQPAAGEHTVVEGTWLTNSVDTWLTEGMTRYVGVGWTFEGHEPSSGTGQLFTVSITNDAVLTWQWETNYFVDVMAATNGSVSPSGGDWYARDSLLTATAWPDAYYHFSQWTGAMDEGGRFDNPLALTVDAPMEITARFEPNLTTNTATPERWLAHHGIATNDFEAAALKDSNGNGMANWQEYIAGTDPTDPDSTFRVLRVTPETGGETRVEWWGGLYGPTTPYVLQSASHIDGPWTEVSLVPRQTGTNYWVGPWPSTPPVYFRVLAVDEP